MSMGAGSTAAGGDSGDFSAWEEEPAVPSTQVVFSASKMCAIIPGEEICSGLDAMVCYCFIVDILVWRNEKEEMIYNSVNLVTRLLDGSNQL